MCTRGMLCTRGNTFINTHHSATVSFEAMSCDVCVEEYDGFRVRSMPPCANCGFKTCGKCFERYQSQNSGLFNVHCMSCKHQWDDDTIRVSLPDTAIKRLEKCTKLRLVRNELEHVVDTQAYVQYGSRIREKVDLYLKESELYCQQIRMVHTAEMGVIDRPASALRVISNTTKERMATLKEGIHAWKNRLHVHPHFLDICPAHLSTRLSRSGTVVQNPPTVQIICPCPLAECRGVVHSNYMCGTCSTPLCRMCLAQHTDDHVCKPEDLDTAKLVLQSSKPCPNCAVRIYKIDGCSQMWCTHCHTAFDWTTLRVQRSMMIHNPHFYQWMHSQNLTNTDAVYNNCDELPDLRHVLRHVRLVFTRDVSFLDVCTRTLRACQHILAVQIEQTDAANPMQWHTYMHAIRLPTQVHSVDFMRNFDIRVKWLTREMTDKQFQNVLHRRYKQVVFRSRLRLVYRMVVTVCIHIFHRLLHEQNAKTSVAYRSEFDNIMRYADDCIDTVCKLYKQKRSSDHPNLCEVVYRF